MDFDADKYRRGNPFDFPENPDQLELMIGWFFDRIRVIVEIENHHAKWDGIQQALAILDVAKHKDCNPNNPIDINVDIIYQDGQWFISSAGSANDVLRLPLLAKRFGKIYRHHAKEYATGECHTLLLGGKWLDTVENKKKRDMI